MTITSIQPAANGTLPAPAAAQPPKKHEPPRLQLIDSIDSGLAATLAENWFSLGAGFANSIDLFRGPGQYLSIGTGLVMSGVHAVGAVTSFVLGLERNSVGLFLRGVGESLACLGSLSAVAGFGPASWLLLLGGNGLMTATHLFRFE
ncbi:MAG: hypothetical protein AB1758_36425 [Candidatus Eremiobacterota bacterium]